MKISAKGEYACRAILELALNYEEPNLVQLSDIAQRQEIPFKYLEQIMITLKKAKLIISKRGSAGGYVLAKEPWEITLGQVIRLTEGSFLELSCLENNNGCKRETNCSFSPIWHEVNTAISDIIDRVTFAELAKRHKEGQANMFYI